MIFAFSLIFSFTLARPIFAQPAEGEKVLSLKEIDVLIEQTDYDRALAALSDYIRVNPKAFDAAQKRIDKIMKARTYYVQLADKLLDVMENEPENDEKKLAIIKELEALEKNPTSEHVAFIKQAKIAAEFTYYRAQFRRVMETAVDRTLDRKYSDAVEVVKSGFYMYHDEFYQENPPSVTEPITRTLAELESVTVEYDRSRSSWQSAYNAFIQAVKSKNYSNAVAAWENFRPQMARFAAVRNSAVQKGMFFEELFKHLKDQNPDVGETSYLSFMSHFILGSESIPHSGIIGTMDAEWSFMTENAKKEIDAVVKDNLSDFAKNAPVEKATQKGLSSEFSYLQNADNFSSLALNVNNLYTLLTDNNGKRMEDACPLYTRSNEYLRTLISRINPSLSNYNDFKVMNEELQGYVAIKLATKKGDSDNVDMERVRDLVLKIGDTRQAASDNLNAEWFVSYKADFKETENTKQSKPEKEEQTAKERRAEKKANAFARENSLKDWSVQNKFYEAVNNLTFEQSTVAIGTVWKDFANYYAALAKEIQENYSGVLDTAIALSSGITDETPAENNPDELAPGHYPQEASQNVQTIKPSLSEDLEKLEKMQKDFNLGPQNENSAQRAEIEKAVAALQQHNDEGSKIINNAQEELRLAQSARERADELYNIAQSAYQRQDFDGARQNIQRARELYNESLSHQESAALRESSDRNLARLGEQVNEAENKFVVTEVRNLKTRAKGEYYAGNFENAENLLNRAETRWAVTNVEEDEEIKSLKLLVQNALAMKTGREIKPTAPLYPEMSQILSNAHQYYDRGEALMKQGKRDEAVEVLNGAKKKLQELQLVYPLNQEAALLTLRIERLIDPVEFNEIFARRVEAARENVKVLATQQSAYSDLLDLYEIRPDYPGLRDLIYNVEMDLGLRARPVDRSGILRSNALTQEAQSLYNRAGGNEEVMRQALARLDEAISLNPNNESAIMLKDRIQIAVGGKAAVVLSSVDEAEYNRAIQELRNNNIMGAYTIVQQLLQKPANRRSSKILDLQKQIQARL